MISYTQTVDLVLTVASLIEGARVTEDMEAKVCLDTLKHLQGILSKVNVAKLGKFDAHTIRAAVNTELYCPVTYQDRIG